MTTTAEAATMTDTITINGTDYVPADLTFVAPSRAAHGWPPIQEER